MTLTRNGRLTHNQVVTGSSPVVRGKEVFVGHLGKLRGRAFPVGYRSNDVQCPLAVTVVADKYTVRYFQSGQRSTCGKRSNAVRIFCAGYQVLHFCFRVDV